MSVDERFAVISAGFTGDIAVAQNALSSTDDSVRASAVRSLQRLSALTAEHISTCIDDASSEVRRTAGGVPSSGRWQRLLFPRLSLEASHRVSTLGFRRHQGVDADRGWRLTPEHGSDHP